MDTQDSPIGRADLPPLALIAGPTASGKSGLALGLAERLDSVGTKAVIINADSAQVYSDLRVLSARPSAEEERAMPHRLYGAWDGAVACSAADWAEAARAEIAAAHASQAVPILVGGTGLYTRTLLEGIAPIPAIDPAIREEVRALPTEVAYAALQGEDPARASKLNPNDSQRIARALEVIRSTGQSLEHWHDARTDGLGGKVSLAPVVLLPPRERLYARCDARFVQMMDEGAIPEVEALLARALDPDLPVMRAIGVREIAALLKGEVSRAQAIASGQQATRNYAKRQYTWLRGQTPAEWARLESEYIEDTCSIEQIFHMECLTRNF